MKKFKLHTLIIDPLRINLKVPFFDLYSFNILEIRGTYWDGELKGKYNNERVVKRFSRSLLELGLYTIDYAIVGHIFFIPFKLNLDRPNKE